LPTSRNRVVVEYSLFDFDVSRRNERLEIVMNGTDGHIEPSGEIRNPPGTVLRKFVDDLERPFDRPV